MDKGRYIIFFHQYSLIQFPEVSTFEWHPFSLIKKHILKKERNSARFPVMLQRMEHRGACGCDNDAGDGAGVFAWRVVPVDSSIIGRVAKTTEPLILQNLALLECIVSIIYENFNILLINCRMCIIFEDLLIFEMIFFLQPFEEMIFFHPKYKVFVVDQDKTKEKAAFQRKVYLLRKYSCHKIPENGLRYYLCSLSTETIVYKITSQYNNPYRD
ncbi:hypothetical protein KUTeg_007810 [Tegillarca granosa]|uniref:glutamate synthase (ferredoxin) n=1 Tax=Tegillarca granosa TaxID=220873 RepID=A0ABQ9FIZ7_TEGGR|nr:hypothetical protein KUTeg_007810 [Tegillarca granosa]